MTGLIIIPDLTPALIIDPELCDPAYIVVLNPAAATYAAAAEDSAAAAAAAETSAATSASAAASSASSASTTAATMAATLASFRSVFLGAFADDSSATAFANANSITLADGVMYDNTTEDKFRIYASGAWEDYDASAQASQTAAALSAANAATSEANAAASASLAQTAEESTQTSLTSFLSRYIGGATTDPTVDGAGNALTAGVLYFNTTSQKLRVYYGGTWVDASPKLIIDIFKNIVILSPTSGLTAFADDLGQMMIADGTQWWVSTAYFSKQPLNNDIGCAQQSNRGGYGQGYVTDKALANCTIGYGSSSGTEGMIRHDPVAFTTSIYSNGGWRQVVAGIPERQNNGVLEHMPVANWIKAYSGDSETPGLNGLPLVQGYHASIGAFPVPQVIGGASF